MSVNFGNQKKAINDKRRENKKKTDKFKKGSLNHELNVVFNTFYRDQVAALYKQVTKGK